MLKYDLVILEYTSCSNNILMVSARHHQGCQTNFHNGPHQHHGCLLKGRLYLKLCVNYSQTYCEITLFACDYCLFECRNIAHENISLILSHESNSFETFKYRIGYFSEISSKKRWSYVSQAVKGHITWRGGPDSAAGLMFDTCGV